MLQFVALRIVAHQRLTGPHLAGFEREVARSVNRVVDWLRNGLVPEVLVGMAGGRRLDQGTLQRLAERIAEARSEKEKGKAERKE
jgi:hypothetical protein